DYPFLPGAGVVGHEPRFAFQRFALGRDDEAPELAAYLNGLLDHARRLGRRPLFKFCRGFLRQRWLEAQLDPVTVYLARQPGAMLASYARIGPYFHGGYLRILAENRNAPLFEPIFQRLATAHPDYGAADEALRASDRYAATVPAPVRRDVFLFFWALALAANARPDILLLDAAALGGDQQASAEALRQHTGLDVDLADAVALDPGEAEVERFDEPAFGGWLRDAIGLTAPGFDAAALPPSLRRQFEALVAAD
ncbi:MAG: hypothetical protein KGM15_03175, partial [Pseudomonadota bacterium]|nr:hypothetical protein [Pseudomonadota bacterium]